MIKTQKMDYLLNWIPQKKKQTVVHVAGMKNSLKIKKETNCVLLGV